MILFKRDTEIRVGMCLTWTFGGGEVYCLIIDIKGHKIITNLLYMYDNEDFSEESWETYDFQQIMSETTAYIIPCPIGVFKTFKDES